MYDHGYPNIVPPLEDNGGGSSYYSQQQYNHEPNARITRPNNPFEEIMPQSRIVGFHLSNNNSNTGGTSMNNNSYQPPKCNDHSSSSMSTGNTEEVSPFDFARVFQMLANSTNEIAHSKRNSVQHVFESFTNRSLIPSASTATPPLHHQHHQPAARLISSSSSDSHATETSSLAIEKSSVERRQNSSSDGVSQLITTTGSNTRRSSLGVSMEELEHFLNLNIRRGSMLATTTDATDTVTIGNSHNSDYPASATRRTPKSNTNTFDFNPYHQHQHHKDSMMSTSSYPTTASTHPTADIDNNAATDNTATHLSLNPLDSKSPFFDLSFALKYETNLKSLVGLMEQTSESRKAYDQVKKQLKQNEKDLEERDKMLVGLMEQTSESRKAYDQVKTQMKQNEENKEEANTIINQFPCQNTDTNDINNYNYNYSDNTYHPTHPHHHQQQHLKYQQQQYQQQQYQQQQYQQQQYQQQQYQQQQYQQQQHQQQLPHLFYSKIKRARSSKKKQKYFKKIKHNNNRPTNFHRRSLSLKFCTPEMIFGRSV
jgi:hypothetical protein